jgi:hypothetical protein
MGWGLVLVLYKSFNTLCRNMFISIIKFETGSVERKVQEETVVKFFSLLQASRIYLLLHGGHS